MSWFIDDRTRREIEEALGGSLPPPTSEEFRTLMQRLAAEHPDLRQRILEALSASPVELPSERHTRRLVRQAFIRRLLFGWLQRETFAGDVIWDKRRILASAFGAIALLLVAMFVVNQATWRPPLTETPGGQAALPAAAAPTPSRPPIKTLPAMPRWPSLPVATATPPPSTPSAAPAGRMASTVAGRPSVRPPVGPPAYPDVPGSLWPSTFPQANQQPATNLPRLIIQEAPERREPSRVLIVYDAQHSAASPAAGAAPQGAVVYDRGGQTASAPPPSGVATPAPRAGQMTAARLVTALALVAGAGPMPVVATSDTPTLTWLGDATMGADGLIQITFHTMVGDQAALPVRAVALDATSRRPGLDAQVKTVARHTAAAVVGAALRSTTDYVQALLQQRQVTITNGWAAITSGEAPPFWMLLGSRLAELLAPRAQEAARPIQVAEVPAGTGLTILVLQGSGGR